MPETSLSPATDPGTRMDPVLSQWVDLIRTAAKEERTVRICGSGSKSFFGEPVDSAAWTLDTRAYSGIVSYEPTELVITVKAGTSLREVEATLAAQGQYLAFEPPHFGEAATVGGAVATGLSGPARASVGALRDFVLGVHLVNGRGEYLEFGGQVMKNVAGYDVSRLLAGSLGTLGVLAQISLKVLPLAPAEATLRFRLPQSEALAQLARWRGLPLPLNASCWVQDTTAEGQPEILYVRLRGAQAAVQAACARMLADVPGDVLDTTATATDWVACREQTLPFFAKAPNAEAALWRLSVAPTTPALELPWPTLVEWHGAQRWLWAPVAARPQLRELANQAGGHATLFRPPASAPDVGERFTPPDPALLIVHQRLKAAFDPASILNPGRWGFGL